MTNSDENKICKSINEAIESMGHTVLGKAIHLEKDLYAVISTEVGDDGDKYLKLIRVDCSDNNFFTEELVLNKLDMLDDTYADHQEDSVFSHAEMKYCPEMGKLWVLNVDDYRGSGGMISTFHVEIILINDSPMDMIAEMILFSDYKDNLYIHGFGTRRQFDGVADIVTLRFTSDSKSYRFELEHQFHENYIRRLHESSYSR